MPAQTAAVAREQRKTARREAILAAAQDVFAEKGFDGATIADIAKAAGVASGTVYLYYESKIELFAALNARLWEVVIASMQQGNVPSDVRGGTSARIRAVFETAHEHRDLLRLVFLNPDPRTEVARRMNHSDNARMKPLVRILQDGMEAGVVREGDPTMLAKLISNLVIIGLYQCFIERDGSDVVAFQETVTNMIVGALAPAPC
jgi:AcrR family transcriptional regulator